MLKTVSASCLLVLLFTNCAESPSPYEEETRIKREEYEKLFAEKENELKSTYNKLIEVLHISDTAAVTDTFLISDPKLGFQYRLDSHPDSSILEPGFNAIFLGSYAATDTLPLGMYPDYFSCKFFRCLQVLTDSLESTTLTSDVNSAYVWAQATIFINAVSQLRYVVVVRPDWFFSGDLNVDGGTFRPDGLRARILVYDLKEDRICGVKKISASGTGEFTIQYDSIPAEGKHGDITPEVNKQGVAESAFKNNNKNALITAVMATLGSHVTLSEVLQ